jgi:hypothetical protein
LPPEARDQVSAFAQILDAKVTHVVLFGAPDPVFPRDAPHDWGASQRQRNDRAREVDKEARGDKGIYELEQEAKEKQKSERQRRKNWLDQQRQIARGWAKYLYWRECFPQEAQAYQQEHEDEYGQWLIEMAGSPRFKRRPKVTMSAEPKRPKPQSSPRARGMGS